MVTPSKSLCKIIIAYTRSNFNSLSAFSNIIFAQFFSPLNPIYTHLCGFGTVACAWHRQVRLAALAAAKHTPRKSKQRNDRKTKPKARRRGAVPAEPLWDRLPLSPPRNAFFHWFLPFIAPLEFAFSVGYGSIVPRGRQRPQNRR